MRANSDKCETVFSKKKPLDTFAFVIKTSKLLLTTDESMQFRHLDETQADVPEEALGVDHR